MAERPLEEIQGTVEDVVYHNEDTGFTVLGVSVGDELITVVGETPDIAEGEEITATGSYGVHPSYGVQFKAQLISRTLPSTANAISRYLASGAIKGIGPAFARRIVSVFGDKTLEIMEKEPQRLTEVKGISPAKAAAMGEEFARLFGIRSVMIFLTGQGVQPAVAIKIWKRWGSPAMDLIRSNPYVLCQDEIGVGFEDADRMAGEFGLEADSYRRISAGVVYILRHNARQGHCCLPREKLLPMAVDFLELSGIQIEDAIEEMLLDNTLGAYVTGGRVFLYVDTLFRAESYVAGRISLMLRMASPTGGSRDVKEVEALGETLGIVYDDLQKRAILEAMESPVFILTGGPGTGKTTALRGILAMLEARGERVALAAPTGRAAKRMTEVTGYESKTIHRLLEVEPFQPSLTFKRNEKNPLPADVVIVDEMSMVDILIMESLFRGLRLGARLILVGDSDQLPSVSAGNVLGDLIASGLVPTVHLDRVFRQAQESLIVTGAHDIVHGEVPQLKSQDRERDFFFLEMTSPQVTRELVADLCVRRLPQSYGYSPLWDIQVIVPGKQGPLGTRELNRLLQQSMNPPDPQKSQMESFGRVLREGDKVMQIKNNYDITWETDDGDQGQGIYNGDIGVIEMIDPPSKTILVRFEELVVCYPFDAAEQLEHAYAITIHKSQGSEFEAVVMPLLGSHRNLHYRNLLYTGFTRAKSLLIIPGSPETVAAMVANNRRTLRYTNLREMLEEQMG